MPDLPADASSATKNEFRAPDLFVIGAAKAATSSLQRWLGDHPDIGISRIEETRYLMDAHDPLAQCDGYAVHGLDGYAAYFPEHLRRGCRHTIDVTPMYYYQDVARTVIPALPDAQVIFVARRPGARLKSLYEFARNNISVLPEGLSFAGFVAEAEKGADSPLLRNYPMMCHALAHSEYARYLRDWTAQMGKERVHVLIFEDLVRDPVGVVTQLAVDLGIDPEFYATYAFPRENESYQVRNHRLHRMVRKLRARMPAGMRRRVRSAYMRLNTDRGGPSVTESDRAVMARVDALLIDSEQDLARMLGRATIWTLPQP